MDAHEREALTTRLAAIDAEPELIPKRTGEPRHIRDWETLLAEKFELLHRIEAATRPQLQAKRK